MTDIAAEIRPLDIDALARAFRSAEPFPHCAIDDFLAPEFADALAAAYPSFDEADALGLQFKALNEYRKIQITESERFPAPVRRLHELLAAPSFLEAMSAITGIDALAYDPALAGGGMHITGPHGRLDVHVDFNWNEALALHRRINLLLYLNPGWDPAWKGAVELWDADVRRRVHAFAPVHNRAVMFATSDRSFHGVEEVRCPEGRTRNSFAVYYYSSEPPEGYAGHDHSTIFKARPDEHLKRYVLMPAERAKGALREGRAKARNAKNKLKGLLGRG
jgi:hypothetical protein